MVTGYLLPWSVGQPIDILGVILTPPPFTLSHDVHEIVEEAHEISGQAFIPLLALHLLGAAKHTFIDRDGVARRVVRPVAGGR